MVYATQLYHATMNKGRGVDVRPPTELLAAGRRVVYDELRLAGAFFTAGRGGGAGSAVMI